MPGKAQKCSSVSERTQKRYVLCPSHVVEKTHEMGILDVRVTGNGERGWWWVPWQRQGMSERREDTKKRYMSICVQRC